MNEEVTVTSASTTEASGVETEIASDAGTEITVTVNSANPEESVTGTAEAPAGESITSEPLSYEEFMSMHDSNYTEPEQTASFTDITREIFTSENTTEAVSAVVTLEEEAIETEVTTTVVQQQAAQQESKALDLSSLEQYKSIILIVLIAAVCIFIYPKLKTKGGKGSAKQRDAERLSKERKDGAEKKNKNNAKKKVNSARKTVAATLPYRKCLANDIWELNDNRYSKVYKIDDINYNLGDENQQDNILYSYRMFLNSLDDTEECQISVMNEPIDIEKYERAVLVERQSDEFDELRQEYNERVLIPALSKGNNAIRKNIYITMTIKAPDEEVADRRFKTIDLKLKNGFDKIGSTRLEPLTNQERLEVVKTFFIDKEYKLPIFTEEELKKGIEKTYICPDYFDFTKPDYFMFGDYYCKTVFIKEYPHEAGDTIIKDLIATNINMAVTTTAFAYDSAKARQIVQRKIGDVTADMGQREQKAVKAGYFSTTMPQRIKNMLEDFKMLFDMISVEDQKLFLANTIIMVKAKTYDELKSNMEIIASSLKSNGCSYSEMKYQQEEGLWDALPIGTQRRFQWNRTLPSESLEILTPFNVKEIQQDDAVYYGCNRLSNNIICFNRMRTMPGFVNPAGFILGVSGSGKSFYVKREMMDVFLRYADAEIIVIDPEREYVSMAQMFKGQSIKISTGSKNYINPFDFDNRLLEEEDYDVIKEKSQLITSFIACMYNNRPLTPQEQSFIDRCVRLTYINSHYLETLDPNDIPVLGDMYEIMKAETENVDPNMKRDMLATLEMYVGDGSANYFNHRSSVNIYNRFVSFDIKELTGVLKTQAMLLVLDNIWNRLSANRDRGIPTWIYVDEIHVLFENTYCRNFIQQLYKRARKYGGVITGITQNIIDILRDDSCVTMLANCEFIVMLKQSPSDIIKLKEVLHYSDSELAFVENVAAGEGLLSISGNKLPFYDKFPKDTKLYANMSTAFNETKEIMEKSTVTM